MSANRGGSLAVGGVREERPNDLLMGVCDPCPRCTGGRVGLLDQRREQKPVGFAAEQQLAAEPQPGARL